MSKNLGDLIFGSLYIIPTIIGSIFLTGMIYALIIDNQKIFSHAFLGLALIPALIILKRTFNPKPFNYKKYGLKDEEELKSIFASLDPLLGKNDPGSDVCKCGQLRLAHGTKYCKCENFEFLEKYSKRFEQ